jgi:hypothetical protein
VLTHTRLARCLADIFYGMEPSNTEVPRPSARGIEGSFINKDMT